MAEEKKEKSFGTFTSDEIEEIKKMWGNLDTSKESFSDVGKKLKNLEKTFDEAVKNGADKDTLKSILGDWQMEKLKLDAMTQTLNKFDERDRPDVMKDYIDNSYKELGKGVEILNSKTQSFIGKIKEGIIKSGKQLTDKIKDINEKIKPIFKEKQEILAQNFSIALDKTKDKLSEASLNAMVATAKRAESFDRLNSRSKKELQSGIKATLKHQNHLLDKNNKNLARKFKSIEESKYTKSSRIKAGKDIIRDAFQGKEYQEHKPEEKTIADLGKEYQQAMKEASRASNSIEFRTKGKIAALKAWSKLEQGVANVGKKISLGLNYVLEKGIDRFGSKELNERVANLNQNKDDLDQNKTENKNVESGKKINVNVKIEDDFER